MTQVPAQRGGRLDPALAAETREHLAATAKLRYEREPSDEHLDAALAAARQAQDGGRVAELLLELYAERGDVRAAREALTHYRRALSEAPRVERPEARLRLAIALCSVSEGEDFPEALEESVALLRQNLRVRGLDPKLRTVNASLFDQIMDAEQGLPSEVEIIFNPAYLEPPARPDGQSSAREEPPASETTRLRRLYERNGDLPTLAEAGRRALDVPKGTPAWRGAATELAVALSPTYATTRNQAVFDESRDLFQAALTGGRLMLAGEEPLAVADIARLNVPEGRMAFLSACGTAQGSITILDQAIHICSAFQLAGYSDVIGTLWPVADGVAYGLTEDVYTRLSAGEIPALALHHAVRETRDRFPCSPWLWAAFAHYGP
ncbi:CHAT domain-containing protein [Nonomuraea sp. SYSU D8015]|uniref:CHAT domain-containing protein n=1 Tax=Nonomuraea sp. SYSU D8015 TaxID=2593644 RepID=UPI0016607747|nr:CHAT domain-containing protein [Nonomuraea sp. SYSU D8015]